MGVSMTLIVLVVLVVCTLMVCTVESASMDGLGSSLIIDMRVVFRGCVNF